MARDPYYYYYYYYYYCYYYFYYYYYYYYYLPTTRPLLCASALYVLFLCLWFVFALALASC